MERRLATVAPFRTQKLSAKTRVLAKGFRKNVPEAGFELTISEVTAWINAHEALRLLEGTISILEDWNGSPAELFISHPASASTDSPAGSVMANTPADHLGILHPVADGTLQLLATLTPEEQQRLAGWLRTFAQG